MGRHTHVGVQRESVDVGAPTLRDPHALDVASPARSLQRPPRSFPHHGHPLHRSGHARQQHRTVVLDRRDLVVLDLAAAPQHPHHSLRHLHGDACDVLVARLPKLHEPFCACTPPPIDGGIARWAGRFLSCFAARFSASIRRDAEQCSAAASMTAVCTMLPARLQLVRTQVLVVYPVPAAQWTVPPAYAAKKKAKKRGVFRRLFGG